MLLLTKYVAGNYDFPVFSALYFDYLYIIVTSDGDLCHVSFCSQVVETLRRILLTGVLALISDGSAIQIIIGMVISLFFIKLYSHYGECTVSTSSL